MGCREREIQREKKIKIVKLPTLRTLGMRGMTLSAEVNAL